jgi:putative DNA methylase
MTEPYRKKLIEVALPLKAINDESSLRKRKAPAGYPTTLHKWWAQRPLAACRAVLFASLVDDPDSDPAFRNADGVDEDRAGTKRADLFNLIEELILWENSNNDEVIRSARAEIARCVASQLIESGKLAKDTPIGNRMTAGELVAKGHCMPVSAGMDKKLGRHRWRFQTAHLPPAAVVDKFLAEHAPPVLDPFCGGGSIPLEAQRLGLRAYASDLNPIAVLTTKALIEIPPPFAGRPPVNPDWQNKSPEEKAARVWRGAAGLAEDVRYYGKWMRDEAEKLVGGLYPKVRVTAEMAKGRPDLEEYIDQELVTVAWMWARTVPSPNPAYQGCAVPLVSSYWLSKKKGRESWIEPIVVQDARTIHFAVRHGRPDDVRVTSAGTKIGRGGNFQCLLSRDPIPVAYIRQMGKEGKLGSRLTAIVAEGRRGRVYLPPVAMHEQCAEVNRPDAAPEELIAENPRDIRCQLYGLQTFADIFTNRQLTVLLALGQLTQEVCARVRQDLDVAGSQFGDDYAVGILTYLACAVDRAVDYNSALASWRPKDSAMRSTLGKQAIPMVWDFAEANPLAKSSAGILECTKVIAKCVEMLPAGTMGYAKQLDATAAVNGVTHPVVCTDPPYYANISYADLSDFFYVWLRRSLSPYYPNLFSTVLTPKKQELIASPYRHDGVKERAKEFFETQLGHAFERVRDAASSEFPITVFYAFKQTESEDDDDDDDRSDDDAIEPTAVSTGWETMLEGLIRAKLAITGTWPMRTEGDNRQVGIGANALASSIVLVCRPRPTDARLAIRKEFMGALRQELPAALSNLRHGNVAPVDLAQAAIGPGMAVFTRFAKVIETDGTPMSVRTALGLINQVLDEVLTEEEGEFDADTRWAVSWFEQFGMNAGPFGEADVLARAKNTAVNGLEEAGVVKSSKGRVSLIRRADLSASWDPATDGRLTAWETTQHLIRTLEQDGEAAAATLVNKLGGMAETARDLAYRLYSICERKKWTEEALAYNGLVIAWPELTKLAQAERSRPKQQTTMLPD